MIWSILGYTVFILSALFQKQITKFLDIFGENNAWNLHYKNKKIDRILSIFSQIMYFLVGSIGLVSLILIK